MRCIFIPIMAGLFALSLAACSKQGPEAAPHVDTAAINDQLSIGLAIPSLNSPFFVELRDSAIAEAGKQGLKLIAVDAQDDPARQQASVEDLIQKKVRVILLTPTDSRAVANVVREATSNGIKVVSLDRRVDGAEVSSHIASDNVAGGEMAGKYLLDKLGGKGRIVELEGILGTSTARERGQGFHKVVDNKEQVKLLAKQSADFNRAKGLAVMENIIQSNKDIQGVFAHNDEMALGAVKAIQAAGLKNVAVVGFDATPDAIAAVKAGELSATVQQQPALIGQYGVQTAKKLLDGQSVPKLIPVPLNLIQK
ncbi:D-ribose ABC transporter substrate-binding protein [Chromobacterium vaccinii]|uniref:D-ribose ABC transporter substrate-binding protein n=1 Tax=Chromobacterium vaccinii TaxID=1108595 RepID=UPI000E17C4BA|nr:D-ribose ABC transporter substrate-binding protein [Chromobacterium vaccinii]SUX54067.1 D-ribose-binding periplasmic protein precursor [Chromobacterium vaccinii]